MPHDPTLPKHLLHLLEKRQGPGRRKQDDAKSAAATGETLPDGEDRRKANRRKTKPAKTRHK